MSVFVDDAAGAVVSSGPKCLEVGDFGREWPVRCSAGQCHVRAVAVVVGLVLAQDVESTRFRTHPPLAWLLACRFGDRGPDDEKRIG